MSTSTKRRKEETKIPAFLPETYLTLHSPEDLVHFSWTGQLNVNDDIFEGGK